jgi:hypothetical protein
MRYRSENRAASLVAACVIVIGLVSSLATPATSLDRVATLRTFAEFMGSLVPSIDHLAGLSAFPQVTRLSLSILWASTPLQVIVLVWTPGSIFSVEHIRKKLLPITLLYLSFVPAVIAFALFLLGADVDLAGRGVYTRTIRVMSNSRIALGLLGPGIVLAVSVCVASMVLWIKHWPTLYFGKR